jgi:acyl-CoA thioester hydrolase
MSSPVAGETSSAGHTIGTIGVLCSNDTASTIDRDGAISLSTRVGDRSVPSSPATEARPATLEVEPAPPALAFPEAAMLTQHDIEFRVRYQETDAMGFVHHANYLTWYEMGRVELLRAGGGNYRQMEEDGLFLVVVRIECRYRRPARYDDWLRLRTSLSRVATAKIEHDYELYRGEELLAEAHTVMGCVDTTGTIQRLPGWMRGEPQEAPRRR